MGYIRHTMKATHHIAELPPDLQLRFAYSGQFRSAFYGMVRHHAFAKNIRLLPAAEAATVFPLLRVS